MLGVCVLKRSDRATGGKVVPKMRSGRSTASLLIGGNTIEAGIVFFPVNLISLAAFTSIFSDAVNISHRVVLRSHSKSPLLKPSRFNYEEMINVSAKDIAKLSNAMHAYTMVPVAVCSYSWL